ncbi:MAG: hypothetical protein KAI45_09800 [Melioribacteraceae bacterium]|nr:hypothetical protein [Melioribacteraceae bacterium]
MNYTRTIKVKAKRENAFFAISNKLFKWWGTVDCSTSKIGDEFSIFFGETEWRFKIIEFSEYEKITWRCIKANHVHDGLLEIKEEWLNTEIFWNFISANGIVEISFLHKGLKPELNCYKICEAGWDYFISISLKSYLETGNGNPYNE